MPSKSLGLNPNYIYCIWCGAGPHQRFTSALAPIQTESSLFPDLETTPLSMPEMREKMIEKVIKIIGPS